MSPLSTNPKTASQCTRFRQARKQSSYTEANRIRNKLSENAKPLLWAYLCTCPYAARSSPSEIVPPVPSSSLNLQVMAEAAPSVCTLRCILCRNGIINSYCGDEARQAGR
ncbi:hypothetical protein HZ326_23003 [Fusarium oxysporum f. sp. albedinis]|nr:hypothetical protein HZ326_23003 [Fusarium oxysporum f. sp. albedinis]